VSRRVAPAEPGSGWVVKLGMARAIRVCTMTNHIATVDSISSLFDAGEKEADAKACDLARKLANWVRNTRPSPLQMWCESFAEHVEADRMISASDALDRMSVWADYLANLGTLPAKESYHVHLRNRPLDSPSRHSLRLLQPPPSGRGFG